MSLTFGTLAGVLDLDDGPFDQKLQGADSKFGGFTKAAGLAAAGAGAAIAAVGVKGILAFADFQGHMNEVFTLLPGISEKAMSKMTGQVKDFSKEFGVLPDKVVPALYQSLSAGVPPDNVFAFLETAQKAAKGGVTDLTTAVDGISSVVNAYGSDVVSATNASDAMFTAVRLGKTNFTELSQSLFNVIPTASALGVKFGDVTAALAAMTVQGVPTSVATTQLRQLFVELSKAGSGAADTFTKISGKSFKEFIDGGGNVQQALQLMVDHADKAHLSVSDLFSSVEAGNAALSLTGKGAKTFGDDITAMGASTGATQAAFETMNSGIGASFDRIKAAVAVALIDLGEKLAPTVAKLADFIEANLPRVSAAFDNLGQVIHTVVDFIQGVLALFRSDSDGTASKFGESTARISAFLSQLEETFKAIFDAISAIVTVAVIIISDLWDRFGQHLLDHIKYAFDAIMQYISGVLQIIQGVFDIFAGIFTGDWGRVWDGIKEIFGGAWDAILGLLKGAINYVSTVIGFGMALVSAAWGLAWHSLATVVTDIWDGIKDMIGKAVKWILDQIDKMLGPLDEIIAKIASAFGNDQSANHGGNSSTGGIGQGWGHFATGVTNFRGGLAWVGENGPELLNLPSGSDIIPNNQVANLFGRISSPGGSSPTGDSGGSLTPVVELDAYLLLDGQALDGITVKIVDRTGLSGLKTSARARGLR